MMKTNQEYKNQALAALKGNWAPAVVAAVVLLICMYAILAPSWIANMCSIGALGISLSPSAFQIMTWIGLPLNIFLLYPLVLGYTSAHDTFLKNADSRITANSFGIMFTGYLRNVWAVFLIFFFCFLWSLLLIIPGIIKSFAYAMTPYILKDYPELSANQAINLSVKIMKGHKFDFFWLNLSFIGWMILGLFTMTIGYVWLMPYMYTSFAAFYQDVKKDYIERTNI